MCEQKCVGASSELSNQVTLGIGGIIPRHVDIAEPINMDTNINLVLKVVHVMKSRDPT